MVHELLYSTLSLGRAMLLEHNKRFAMLVCGELNADGLYQLRGQGLRKQNHLRCSMRDMTFCGSQRLSI